MVSLSLRRLVAPSRYAVGRAAVSQVRSRRASTGALYGVSTLVNCQKAQSSKRVSGLPLVKHCPTPRLLHASAVRRSPLDENDSHDSKGERKTGGQHSGNKEQEHEGKDKGQRSKEQEWKSHRARNGNNSFKDIWDEKALKSGQTAMAEYRNEIRRMQKSYNSLEARAENQEYELAKCMIEVERLTQLKTVSREPYGDNFRTGLLVGTVTTTLATLIYYSMPEKRDDYA